MENIEKLTCIQCMMEQLKETMEDSGLKLYASVEHDGTDNGVLRVSGPINDIAALVQEMYGECFTDIDGE